MADAYCLPVARCAEPDAASQQPEAASQQPEAASPQPETASQPVAHSTEQPSHIAEEGRCASIAAPPQSMALIGVLQQQEVSPRVFDLLDAIQRSELHALCALRGDDFCAQDERAALVSADSLPEADAKALLQVTVPRLPAVASAGSSQVRLGSLSVRLGFSVRGALVVLHVCGSCSMAVLFRIPQRAVRATHIALSQLLGAASDAQVYRPPWQNARQQPLTDSAWDEWSGAGGPSDEYQAYRQSVDPLIEEAIREHCVSLHDSASVGSAGSRPHLTILEICGGDGALAHRLLDRLGRAVSQYTMTERNAVLVDAARQRLSHWDRSIAHVVQSDAAADEHTYASLRGQASVVIGAGSVRKHIVL